MKYIYQARSKEGKAETGTVEASSKEAAAVLLQKYNIFVTSIREQTPRILRTENIFFINRVSKKDLAIFSRQLAVMLQSRVPVTQSLKSLAAQTKNPGFRDKILKISQLVEEGNSLSEAFSTFPEVFNIFYISLIKTGEASGKISESLYYLSDHLEREYDITTQILGAMIYPAFVITVLIGVVLIVMFFVMPRLVDLLQQTAAEPPLVAKVMIGFYDFLQHYGWVVVIGFFFFVLFIVYYFTTKEGKKNLDKIILKIPFIGGFFKKIFLIRFTENISTLISAGLSISNALKITKDTINNTVYNKIISEIEKGVSEGERISSVLVRYPEYAPPFVVQMIQVGEETGTLDKNLMEIVNFYQKEVDRAVITFTALLEPVLIIFLGAIVAILAVSVIEPLYGALGTI
jgi:type IV pilus assembly protein PilC